MLNAKPEFSGDAEFKVAVTEDGKLLPDAWLNSKIWEGNPLSMDHIHIHIQRPIKNKSTDDDDLAAIGFNEDDNEGYTRLRVRGDELVAMFPQEGKFVFRTNEKYEVTLTRINKSAPFHWDAF
jgi:hypothetical protein